MVMDRRRSIITCVILSIITCGIYQFIWIARVHEDLENESQQYSGTSGGMVVLFSILTCGIYYIYWLYKSGVKISYIKRQDLGTDNIIATSDNGLLYLILGIFGLGIVALALMQSDLNDHFTLTQGWQDTVSGGGYSNNGGGNGGGYDNGYDNNGGYQYNAQTGNYEYNPQGAQTSGGYNAQQGGYTYGGPGATFGYGSGYNAQAGGQTYGQPINEQPAYDQPQQPQYGQPIYEQPAQPTYEQPTYEQPAQPDLQFGQPGYTYEAPAAEEPYSGPQMVWGGGPGADVPDAGGPVPPVQETVQDTETSWYEQATEEANQPVIKPDVTDIE